MNKYNKILNDESKGRLLLASYFKLKGIPFLCTTDITDSVDMIATDKNNSKAVVEIKTRNAKYEKYDTYIFEDKKLLGMKKRIKDVGANGGLYVCIFDTHIYIYNIKDIVDNTPLTYKWLPKNSFNDGLFENKGIYNFNKDLALVKVQLINNKWIEL